MHIKEVNGSSCIISLSADTFNKGTFTVSRDMAGQDSTKVYDMVLRFTLNPVLCGCQHSFIISFVWTSILIIRRTFSWRPKDLFHVCWRQHLFDSSLVWSTGAGWMLQWSWSTPTLQSEIFFFFYNIRVKTFFLFFYITECITLSRQMIKTGMKKRAMNLNWQLNLSFFFRTKVHFISLRCNINNQKSVWTKYFFF